MSEKCSEHGCDKNEVEEGQVSSQLRNIDVIEKSSVSAGHSRSASQAQQPPFPSLKVTANHALDRVISRLSTVSIIDPGPPPDGGLKAWTQVAMAFIVVFTTWGYVNSFGAFQTYYTSILPQSPSTISWIGSVQVWIVFFLGAFSGRALDAGLFIPTFIIGVIVQLLGIFMMSLSTKYWQLLITQGILTGIGSGTFFCPSMGLVATYFSKRRGLAVGLVTMGNSAGGAIYPVVVRQLLPKIGFAWTVRVLGFVNLAALAVVLAFMRPRLPPRKAGPIVEFSAFKEPEFALFVAGMSFVIASLYFMFYYLVSFARDEIGLSYSTAVILLVILNGVGVPGRLLPGLLADRYFGVLNVFVPLLLLTTIITYCWLAISSSTSLFIFSCFYGFFSGAFQSLMPTTIASLTKDLDRLGTRLGMCFSTLSFAALASPPISGAILAADGGNYYHAQIWAGTLALVGTCLVAAARVSRFGWKLKVKC
ncbi:MFS transporter, MCP family, solute carrier family 16, member 10 [Glonium stellatum]|uniref:MFS transporter, MCP family, solute carrier family 16, member 10 n=1 Tax=Glonium stellatum TaxID=574774 RepID=A0A8E2F7X2_9PEZI|nr:MFS transporter, MCP family, solute carrier family 16, member 10 [Glonium stellatum]